MRILVTGGAGFIGSHSVERLVADAHSVSILDDFSSGRATNLAGVAGDVTIHRGDVRDLGAVRRAAEGADVIIHAAAIVSVQRSIEHPLDTLDVNVRGTLTVLEAARLAGVHRVVLASSAAVYGDRGGAGDGPLAPRSPYGLEKATAESYARLYRELHGLETVVLRYFNVFGPRQGHGSPYAGVLSVFVHLSQQGEPVTLFGDGEQSRDFVEVTDIAEANLLAATVPNVGLATAPHTFDIGRGTATSLNEALRVLSSLTGQTPRQLRAPARRGDIRHSLASIGPAHDALGYTPRVGLREGLARLLEDLDRR
jgi:UDP-glucose 4-epimerase